MSKRKHKWRPIRKEMPGEWVGKVARARDTGARADVLMVLTTMRTWLANNQSADVRAAWHACTPQSIFWDVEGRVLAFVAPSWSRSIYYLSAISTPAYSLKWLDTVIAHDTAELKARGVL